MVFSCYPIAIRSAGATPVAAAEVGLTANVDELLAKVTPRTKLVFLANPNNPTGTYLPFAEVKRLQASLPADVLLVLDAAYAEYVTRNDYASGIELVATCENVVMTRTFSKIYGLANLRLGWAYGPAHVIDAVNRIRGPFNVNGAAIDGGHRRRGRRRAYPKSGCAQRSLAALVDRTDLGSRHCGDAERRQFPAVALSRRTRRRQGAPTLSSARAASFCAPSPPTACRTACA